MSAPLPDDREERGFTLIEMVTALGIFSIFVVLFAGAVISFAGSIVDARAQAEGAGTNSVIIGTVDRQVRYAEAINFPGTSATGYRYIEFLLPKSVTASALPGCYQWRYNPTTGQVETRGWDISATNTAQNLTAWQTKASLVVDQGGVSYPFGMIPANTGTGVLRQRLQVTLATGVSGAGGELSKSNTTFVARNSSTVSVTNTDANADGQSDTQVCMQAGGRP